MADFNTSAIIKAYSAEVAVSKGQALVEGTAENQANLPAAANGATFLGFALDDAAAGDQVRVQMSGLAKGIAGANITRGDFVMLEGTDGRLKTVTLGASNQYVIGKARQTKVDGDLMEVLICQSIAQGA